MRLLSSNRQAKKMRCIARRNFSRFWRLPRRMTSCRAVMLQQVCVCVCVCVCVYVHMYTYMHVYLGVFLVRIPQDFDECQNTWHPVAPACRSRCVCVCVCVCICVHMNMWICEYIPRRIASRFCSRFWRMPRRTTSCREGCGVWEYTYNATVNQK